MRLNALIVIAAMISLVEPSGVAYSSAKCGALWGKNCTDASVVGGTVEVGSTRAGGNSDARAGGRSGDSGRGALRDHATEPDGESAECTDPLGRCGEYEVVMRDEPTLADVASFAPRLAPLVPEPDGLGIAGLPVNVVAAAKTHTRTGELFDLPVTVRFRPVSFRFDYGDGTTTDTFTGGSTWERLGVAPFTPTDTSHVFARRGTYTVQAAVHFAADVDFGNGWERVPGLLALPAGSVDIRVLEAHTALVERTCRQDPDGIGC